MPLDLQTPEMKIVSRHKSALAVAKTHAEEILAMSGSDQECARKIWMEYAEQAGSAEEMRGQLLCVIDAFYSIHRAYETLREARLKQLKIGAYSESESDIDTDFDG